MLHPTSLIIRAAFLAAFILFFIHLQAQTFNLTHDGLSRSYIAHLPSGFSDADTLPVVFSLHGLVMTAQSQITLSEFNPIADRERFIVVYPQGLPNTTGVNAWNTFNIPYHAGVDDVGFISAMIDALDNNFHIDRRRVYSCGMSNGGFMSYRLACELSDKIAAIASVTGSMTDSMMYYCNPSRPVPILHFHGTSDAIVNYNGVAGSIKSVEASLDYWTQQNNCPATAVETQFPDIDATDNSTVKKIYWGLCDDNVEVIHYKVDGGGHTWPGSSETFFGVGGNVNMDINASEIIWEFFKQYELPQSLSSAEFQTLKTTLSVYPNPAGDLLNIESKEGNRLGTVRLSDLTGKEWLRSEAGGNSNLTLDFSELPAGMYFLTAESGKGAQVFKIIRQ